MPARADFAGTGATPRLVAPPAMRHIALLGNPNTGKTTLFNRLCGARAKTSNFPGTTTNVRYGRLVADGGAVAAEVIDLPGLYELHLDVPESRLCRDVLAGVGPYRPPDTVIVVIDACNLTRNLVLAGEILASGLPTILVLNMVDLAQRRGLTLDAAALSDATGCPVIPMVARKGIGMEALRAAIDAASQADVPTRAASVPPPIDASVDDLARWADQLVERSVGGASAIGSGTDTLTERLDATFTHPVSGVVMFVLVMGGMFYTLFTLAQIPMNLIETTFAELGTLVGRVLPPGALHDLVAEGIIGGIAGTVVFLPQICLLFFLISLLEDTGYLARAAFVMDRLLYRFGLPGHAFVPLLTAHACALPGIMSARLIPDPRDRLATILVAPMMSCSARMPVYVLLTSLLFVDRPVMAGLAFAGCYLLGATAALVTAFVFGRSVLKGRARPMVLELPTYKMPSLTNALLAAKDQGIAFLRTAGTVIMAICIVMWWLSAYPRADTPPEAAALRTSAAQLTDEGSRERALAAADAIEDRATEAGSFAGAIGRTLQPIFAPLGYDWQLTMGVMTSFLAREVFVSTMSVLVGAGGGDLEDAGVVGRIRTATRDDGRPLFTRATSASLLVFFVLAMQCLPTLAVTRRETGSLRWAGLQLAYMSTLAYVMAFATFQGLRALGIE